MNSYDVIAHKDGKFWALEVVGLGHTQARNWGEIEHMAIDFVNCMTDIPLADVTVHVKFAFPQELNAHIANAVRARTEVVRATEEAVVETKQAALGLLDQGCSVREIGHILNVSHQRAHQLVRSA